MDKYYGNLKPEAYDMKISSKARKKNDALYEKLFVEGCEIPPPKNLQVVPPADTDSDTDSTRYDNNIISGPKVSTSYVNKPSCISKCLKH